MSQRSEGELPGEHTLRDGKILGLRPHVTAGRDPEPVLRVPTLQSWPQPWAGP